jgi:hypothetical protein
MLRRSLAALCLLLGLTAFVPAAAPTIGTIQPRGFQRGTEATFILGGARLADAKEVLFYSPGFTVTKLEVVNPTQVKATVKIAPDTALGEHFLRIRTATGLTEMRTFWVGALPVVEEKEPNNDFAAPQKIDMNVTVHGTITAEDVDYYAVELKKGQRLSAEIEGMRLAGTLFDPYLAILNSKRFELTSCDDAPLLGQDPCVSIVAPEDGTYIIQVRESAYGGNGACQYRLHVGSFPRPTAVIPAGGKAGEEIEVTFLGDPSGPFKQKVKVPAQAPVGRFGIHAQDATGISPSPVPFRVSTFPNVIETPDNSNHEKATRVPELPCALNGVISAPGEVDHYRFAARKGQTFDVHCFARRLGSPLDSVMTIAFANGGVIAANDDAIGPDSYFRFTAPEDKEYVLTITDHLKAGGPTYFYRVEFLPVPTGLTVSVPKVAQYSQERQSFAIPRGNRFAALINVRRTNVGGDVILGAEGLPAGVTMHAETMLANLDTIPVVFEAAPTAAVGGTLGSLTAKLADTKAPPVPSDFNQMAELILGPPGQSIYWKIETNKLAAAVTDEVPFTVNIVEPKVPLVQNGSMNLKIVAVRKPGFTAPITVFPLLNIPGVSAATQAVIPENQTETLLPMNAAPNAAVRVWKLAVNATATVGDGPVWVSSQLASLEVAPPLVAFNLERGAVEQGQPTDLVCKVQHLAPFDGPAKVKLIGLPTKVTTTEMEITKDTKEFAFKLTTAADSPPGQHKNLFCELVVIKNGEPILHRLGGGELRIDKPIPKTVAVTPTPMPMPMPMQPAKPPEKRLTRLEQLRLEQEEREKAQGNKMP